MRHYVLIQEPRREGVYVQCKDIDQCLHVVDDELKMNLTGTRITMFRKEPRQTAELLAMWYIEREGPRRYAPNPEERHIIAARDAYLHGRVEDIDELTEHVQHRFRSEKLSREEARLAAYAGAIMARHDLE
jgi:hypothetical protein